MAGFGQHTSGESEDWYKACLPEKHELRLLNICDAYVRAEKQKIQLCLTAPDKLTMSIGVNTLRARTVVQLISSDVLLSPALYLHGASSPESICIESGVVTIQFVTWIVGDVNRRKFRLSGSRGKTTGPSWRGSLRQPS